MGLIADYEVAFEHLPLVDVAAAAPEMTLQVEVGQPNQAGPAPFIVRATGESFSRLERALAADPFVAAYSRIGQRGSTRQYQVVPADTMGERIGDAVHDLSELEALAANESIVESITATPEGWRQKRWFADREAFEEYCEFWRTNATAFTVHRLTASDVDATPAMRMTEPQREAVLTAYEMGYFDIPRTTSLDAVADELDISAPALSERLRRAQEHLIEGFVARGGDVPRTGEWKKRS